MRNLGRGLMRLTMKNPLAVAMTMIKRLLPLLLLLAPACFGQTTVNLSVTDTPDNQTWNNGTWTVKLIGTTPGQTSQFSILSGGGSLAVQTGSLSSTGTASMSLPANANIAPTSIWQFSVCSQQGTACSNANITITTSSPQSVTISPPSIRVPAIPNLPPIVVYTTTEISSASLGSQITVVGSTPTTPALQSCTAVSGTTCTTWSAAGGTPSNSPITQAQVGPGFNVVNYGAVNDAQSMTNCTLASSQTQVCTGAGFSASRDVGKEISCGLDFAGAYGSYLAKTTITSVTNSNTVVTAGTAIANQSNAICSWGTASATNDTNIAAAVTAWLAAIHQVAGTNYVGSPAASPVLYFPGGGYLVCNLSITVPTNKSGWKITGDMVEGAHLIFEPGCTQNQGAAPLDVAGNATYGEISYLTFDGMGGVHANSANLAFRELGSTIFLNQIKVENFSEPGFSVGGSVYARGLTALNNNSVGFTCSSCQGDIDASIFTNNQNSANFVIQNVTGLNSGSGLRVGRGVLVDECGNNAVGCTQVVNSSDVWFIGTALFGTSSGFCLNIDGTSFVHWDGGICGTFGGDSNANGPKIQAGGLLQATDLRMVGTGTGKCMTNSGFFNDNGGNSCESMFQIVSGTSTGTTAVLTLQTNVGANVNVNCAVGDALLVQAAGIAGYNGYFTAGTTSGITAVTATTLTYTTAGSNLGALGAGGTANCRNLQTYSGTLPKALLTPSWNTCNATIAPLPATATTICNQFIDRAVNIARIKASSNVVTACTGAPVVTITDGTVSVTLTLTTAKSSWDSTVDASTGTGTTIFKPNGTLTATVGANTCATPPTNLAVTYNSMAILSN